MRVLIADDDPIQRDRLRIALEGWGYEVALAGNGQLAWQMLQADAGDEFSILVTDWLMPEVDGVDLCRWVREAPRDRYLPIILLTSRWRQEDLVAGLNAGADAFLTKPFDPAQLLAQIRIAERILGLEQRLAQQVDELRVVNDRLETDLASAAEVQVSLLPPPSPEIHGVKFAWIYDACDMLAGDMINVFPLDDHRVGMYVLDVSGHGTPAALQSVSLSHVLTPYDAPGGVLKRINTENVRWDVVPPAEVARKLNAQFQMIERSGQFFTFLYGVLDVRTRVLRYVRAGHPGPIVASGDQVRSFDKGGCIPIGIMRDAEYEEDELQLEPGDKLVFYTDGVLEMENAAGQAFGLDRLVASLSPRTSIRTTLARLRDGLETFRDGVKCRDDVTVVGLEI